MCTPIPASRADRSRRETLANWLAVLVLLALGFVWGPANAGSGFSCEGRNGVAVYGGEISRTVGK